MPEAPVEPVVAPQPLQAPPGDFNLNRFGVEGLPVAEKTYLFGVPYYSFYIWVLKKGRSFRLQVGIRVVGLTFRD